MTDLISRAEVAAVVESELRDTGGLDESEIRGILAAIRALPAHAGEGLPTPEVRPNPADFHVTHCPTQKEG